MPYICTTGNRRHRKGAIIPDIEYTRMIPEFRRYYKKHTIESKTKSVSNLGTKKNLKNSTSTENAKETSTPKSLQTEETHIEHAISKSKKRKKTDH